MTDLAEDQQYPCKIIVEVPLPSRRLADAAVRTLSVDQELSPLVRRHLELVDHADKSQAAVLKTTYKATTNRMLRVAVNGFFESLSVVLQVMEELDADVIHEKGLEGLERVQGVEQGMIGETVTGG